MAAPGGFRADPDYVTVMALEQFDQETGRARPADILTRRVNGRPHVAGRAANAYEALLVGLAETDGRVDLDRVAELLGLPGQRAAADALGELVYRDPEQGGTWVTAREYLSGDVRARRAAAARAAAHDRHYRRNVAALDEVVPEELGPLAISVSLGVPWVTSGDIEDFVHDVLGGRVKVWHLPSAGHWKIVPLGRVPGSEYSTSRFSAYDLITAGLNGRSPIVWETEYVLGRRHRVRNLPQSLAAQDRLAALQDRFRTWVWEDAARCERLCAEYNRRFNSHVVRGFDGSQLTFAGLADGIELWPWQRDTVARVLSSRASMCAHAVGAGKTRSIVCAAMTARRLGLATKPMIAVPAHLIEQFAREARQAYPFGRFLVAGEGSRSREVLAARCATGDWDAVIVSHGLLASLPVEPAAELSVVQRRHADAQRQLDAGLGGRFGRTELRRRIARLDRRAERLAAQPCPSVPFESTGVDLLLVDEAHYFKRLPVTSRREGMSFGSSQRAADLMLKAQVLRARRGTLPSIALFTGTPWSNTVAETFVWQSFLQPDVLAAAGIETFDAWSAVFVDYETTVEVSPDAGGFRVATRPSRIRNAPELRAMFSQCADVIPGSELGLERPARNDRTIVCAPGPQQAAYVRNLAARADKIRRQGRRPLPSEDNMLVLCSDGRRAALDPALVGVAEQSSKLIAVADEVARIHHAHAEVRFPGIDAPGVFQIVFCDQGTPGEWGPQTYGRLRRELVARGVPAERVRWVHEARTGAARAELFARCRDGAVSVLIGSTDKLGVGTNVQPRLRALHHADAPWRPSDIEQREGRALRPGNLSAEVDIVRYVTEATFDAYMWQTLQRKARFVTQLYGSQEREIDDIGELALSFAEVKALATGNPLLLEQAKAAANVRRLRTLRSIDTQAVTRARQRAEQADHDRAAAMRLETMLRAARDRLAWFDETYEPSDDAVAALARTLYERLLDPAEHGPEPLRAPWQGLGLELLPAGGWLAEHPRTVQLRITLAHRRVDQVELPVASLRRGAGRCATAVLAAARRWVRDLERRIGQAGIDAAGAFEAGEQARAFVLGHRFARADELATAEARLDEIDTALEASVVEP